MVEYAIQTLKCIYTEKRFLTLDSFLIIMKNICDGDHGGNGDEDEETLISGQAFKCRAHGRDDGSF